jgi:hypothetical protein
MNASIDPHRPLVMLAMKDRISVANRNFRVAAQISAACIADMRIINVSPNLESRVGQAAAEERIHSTFARGGGSIAAHFYRPGFRPSPAHVC